MKTTTKMTPINDGQTDKRGHIATCAECGCQGVYCDTDIGIVDGDGVEVPVDFGDDLVPLLAGTTRGERSDELFCSECAEQDAAPESYTYTDPTGYAGTFDGLIQIDRSGVGHCWVTILPEDLLRGDVLVALADEHGDIADGATATVGGMHYRAIAE